MERGRYLLAADPAVTRAPEAAAADTPGIAAELDRLTALDRIISAAARQRFAAFCARALPAG